MSCARLWGWVSQVERRASIQGPDWVEHGTQTAGPGWLGWAEGEGGAEAAGQTRNDERFGLHSEDKGKLLGNSGPRRATWKQSPRWSSTCWRLIVPWLWAGERSRPGERQTCVYFAGPAGSCGVGMALQCAPRLRRRPGPCKPASVAASQEGLRTLGEAAPLRAVLEEACVCGPPAVTTVASEQWRLSDTGTVTPEGPLKGHGHAPSLRHTSGSPQICSCFNSRNNSPTWAFLCPFWDSGSLRNLFKVTHLADVGFDFRSLWVQRTCTFKKCGKIHRT